MTAAGASTSVPSGAEQIDVSGRTIVPGFINAHGHVGDTRGLESGAGVLHRGERARPARALRECGVTTVASLGGDRAGFAPRDAQRTASFDLALLVAGPVINATTPEEARAEVDKVAATKPDIIKIRVDDNLGTATKMPMAAARLSSSAQARPQGRRAHLLSGRRQGAGTCRVDMLAHGVRDKPVDDELIKLLKARDACVCPTLMREVSTCLREHAAVFFGSVLPQIGRSEAARGARDPKRQETVRTSRAAQGTPRRSTSRPPISSASLTPASASRLAPTPARRRDSRGSSSTKSSR